jgi:hypothetical protein
MTPCLHVSVFSATLPGLYFVTSTLVTQAILTFVFTDNILEALLILHYITQKLQYDCHMFFFPFN